VITRVHHVGLAVRELAGAYGFWRDALGLPLIREAALPDQGVRAALLACGSCEIELLEPTTADGGVARFLARRGEGPHHLCFESDDVRREVSRFLGTGVDMIDVAPRPGLAGTIAFLHPRASGGILCEVATPPDHVPLPEAPAAVTTVHLLVEDVRAAATLYGDLFNLPLGLHRPDWSIAQLPIGGVALHLSPVAPAGAKPGLSGLRLGTPDVDALAARFDAHGIAYRRGPFGLALASTAARGAPLVIHPTPHSREPQRQEGQA